MRDPDRPVECQEKKGPAKPSQAPRAQTKARPAMAHKAIPKWPYIRPEKGESQKDQRPITHGQASPQKKIPD